MTRRPRSPRSDAGSSVVRLAASVALVAGALGLAAFAVLDGDATADEMLLGLAAFVFVVVGALILYRSDGNRVGWVMTGIGVALLLSGLLDALANGGSVVAGAVGGAIWLTWFVLLGLLVFWFPDGKPASQRWGLLVWLGVPIGLLVASYVVAGEICLSANDDGECLEWAVNPIGISWLPNPEFGPLSTVGYMFLALFVILSTASLVSRYVNAHHLQRQQIKWFAFAVCTLIVVTIVQETMAGLTPLPGVVLDVLWGATVLGLPVAIGVAVLRYRLYDIDRIVSRTVTYLLVVGLLGLVFVGLVTVIGSMAPSDSDLAIAASTLAVAALFNPLRRRVQAAIERRFNRARYDAWKVTDAFARSLRNRVDPDDVAAGWRDAVTETMQPESAGVWIRS
ncbi:MAG: hypothetical protein J5I28_08330 [Acidimicrobiales bacterium]|nr:hypothetical protein [Acidimicrobiales bacterium]HLV89780.1 hypothetical protein [Acidimicrobiia bacterium]